MSGTLTVKAAIRRYGSREQAYPEPLFSTRLCGRGKCLLDVAIGVCYSLEVKPAACCRIARKALETWSPVRLWGSVGFLLSSVTTKHEQGRMLALAWLTGQGHGDAVKGASNLVPGKNGTQAQQPISCHVLLVQTDLYVVSCTLDSKYPRQLSFRCRPPPYKHRIRHAVHR